MNDAELAQDLRDEADRLERDMDEYCTQAGAVDIMRRAAARIEAAAGVVAACEELADFAEFNGTEYHVHFGIVNRIKAAIAEAEGARP